MSAQTEMQFDSTAIPAFTKEHARTIATALARSGAVFSFVPVEGDYPNVRGRVADTAREIIDRHAGWWGTLANMMNKAGEITEAGRAMAIGKRRKVNLWRAA